jgi:hypothetical protein
MPNPRMKQRRVVHKSTAGILKPIPEAVDLVGNPPPGLTTKTVAPLQQRVSANRRSRWLLLPVRTASMGEHLEGPLPPARSPQKGASAVPKFASGGSLLQRRLDQFLSVVTRCVVGERAWLIAWCGAGDDALFDRLRAATISNG